MGMYIYIQGLTNMWGVLQAYSPYQIAKNIHVFGGDSSNITIAGESAGAWSVLAHLHSSVPVCHRAIIMSAPAIAPLSPAAAQDSFDQLISLAGIDAAASQSTKIASLRQLSADELVNLGDHSLTIPAWDADWFPHSDPALSLEQAGPLPTWLHSILVGYTNDEYALFGITNGYKKWSADSMIQAVQSAVTDPFLALEVLAAYGMTPTASQETCLNGLLRFGSDVMFTSVPKHVIASNVGSIIPLHLYRFDQRDEFSTSPFHGYAYHALDNAFFCRLPAVAGEHAPPDCRATADALSRAVIAFVYGEEPWESYKTDPGTIYSIDGAKSGMVAWVDVEGPWNSLATTPERETLMREAARRLLLVTES